MTASYFRKGFGLKAAIEGQLTADYSSAVVDAFRAGDYRLGAKSAEVGAFCLASPPQLKPTAAAQSAWQAQAAFTFNRQACSSGSV